GFPSATTRSSLAHRRASCEAWWRRLDSNQRRRKPTDLQSAPFSHSGTPPANLEIYHVCRGSSQLWARESANGARPARPPHGTCKDTAMRTINLALQGGGSH